MTEYQFYMLLTVISGIAFFRDNETALFWIFMINCAFMILSSDLVAGFIKGFMGK